MQDQQRPQAQDCNQPHQVVEGKFWGQSGCHGSSKTTNLKSEVTCT